MSDEPTRPSDTHPFLGTAAPTAAPRNDAPVAVPLAESWGVDPDTTRPDRRGAGGAPADVLAVPGYEVRGEIARGGMGRVLAAYDLSFGREVAIKVVLPGPSAAAAAGRFVREARITGRLMHPNIPPAYELGTLADGSPFLAMKLVRGRTLGEILAGRRPADAAPTWVFPDVDRPDPADELPGLVGTFEQVCQAVGYAHSQGVVHRDLKPANVMVGSHGEVQVMDWGLAVVKDEGRTSKDESGGAPVSDSSFTQAGAVLGTPAFMAPVQARGEDVDARADVFALGGLLAAILTGRPTFRGDDVRSTLAQAAAGNTADVIAAVEAAAADAGLAAIARHCLAANRDARPADGGAVARMVAAYRTGVDDRLRAAGRDAAARAGREAELRKRRRVQLVLGLALAVAAGWVAVLRVGELTRRRVDAERQAAADRARYYGEQGRTEKLNEAVTGVLARVGALIRLGEVEEAEALLGAVDRLVAELGGGWTIQRQEYRWQLVEMFGKPRRPAPEVVPQLVEEELPAVGGPKRP